MFKNLKKRNVYDRKAYYDSLFELIMFIKDKGLKYIKDVEGRQICATNIDWLISCTSDVIKDEVVVGKSYRKSYGMASSVVVFSIGANRNKCLVALKNSDLDSAEYREKFYYVFKKVVKGTILPAEAKKQIFEVMDSEKDPEEEKECIRLMQDVIYAVLPKYFEVSTKGIRKLVLQISDFKETKEDYTTCEDEEYEEDYEDQYGYEYEDDEDKLGAITTLLTK